MELDDMTDGLAAFIKERLDEDESYALSCVDDGGHLEWRVRSGGTTGDLTIRTVGAARPVARILLGDAESVDGPVLDSDAVAAHIVLHDPARALREVEVKRRRLRRYMDATRGVEKWRAEGWMAENGSPAAEVIFIALRREVLEDASIWWDHPDYRAEWKPTPT